MKKVFLVVLVAVFVFVVLSISNQKDIERANSYDRCIVEFRNEHIQADNFEQFMSECMNK